MADTDDMDTQAGLPEGAGETQDETRKRTKRQGVKGRAAAEAGAAQGESAAGAEDDAAGATPAGQGETEAMPGPEELDIAPTSLSPGDIVRGTVVAVADDHVLVDVGYKSEGVLPIDEMSYRPVGHPSELFRTGDTVSVMVLRNDSEDGSLRLSSRRAAERDAYDRLSRMKEAAERIEAPVVEAVKGGLVVDVGARGFIPASQVERGYVENLDQYVGQTLALKIIEVDARKRRVILSRRQVLDEDRAGAREEIWGRIGEGQVLEGTVKSLTDFGAFIDLGGVDGLLHVSELSWGRVQHPNEVLKEGERIAVKVLRLDRERGRISLGLKQVLANPWNDIDRRYPEGSIVKGRVARLAPFGAFVELEPGIDGLIHVSQLSDGHITKPDEAVSVGEEVMVKVLRVDPDQKRVSLSLKEASGGRAPRSHRDEAEGATIGDMVDESVKKDLLGS